MPPLRVLLNNLAEVPPALKATYVIAGALICLGALNLMATNLDWKAFVALGVGAFFIYLGWLHKSED